MVSISSKTSRRFILYFGLVLIGSYGLVWVMYGLAYFNARTSLARHYGGNAANIQSCVDASSLRTDEDRKQFGLNYTQVPTAARPFFVFKGFVYDICYVGNGQFLEARGNVTLFGKVKESSNQQPPQ